MDLVTYSPPTTSVTGTPITSFVIAKRFIDDQAFCPPASLCLAESLLSRQTSPKCFWPKHCGQAPLQPDNTTAQQGRSRICPERRLPRHREQTSSARCSCLSS